MSSRETQRVIKHIVLTDTACGDCLLTLKEMPSLSGVEGYF